MPATSYTLTGPSSAVDGSASTNFTVTPVGGTYTGTITPSTALAGTFSPTSLTWAGTSSAKTFTFTPSAAGTGTISTTASPTLGTDPTGITFTVQAASYTLSGPSSATVGSASTNFTVTPVGGVYTGTITPSTALTGTFSPTSLTWAGTSSAKTFTFKPTAAGLGTISTAASPAIGTDPTPVSFAVQANAYVLTLSGNPTTVVGLPTTDFIITPINGVYTGIITPQVSTISGTFSPPFISWAGTSLAQTFTFTPSIAGTGVISTVSSPALGTDPTGISLTVGLNPATNFVPFTGIPVDSSGYQTVQYTFQVNLAPNIAVWPMMDPINTPAAVSQQTINIPGVYVPLNNGDTFTLYGLRALEVKSAYADIPDPLLVVIPNP